jgi:hypothetical protein
VEEAGNRANSKTNCHAQVSDRLKACRKSTLSSLLRTGHIDSSASRTTLYVRSVETPTSGPHRNPNQPRYFCA